MTVFHLNNMRRHMYRYILIFCTQNVYERLYILLVPVYFTGNAVFFVDDLFYLKPPC